MRNSSFRFPRYVLGLFAVILALSLMYSVGGGGLLRPAVAEAQTAQGAVLLGKDSPLIRAVIAIQNRHTGNLMRIPGIVGTGTGVGLDGQPVIKVFAARAGIPGIPHKLEGVPVEVEVTGIIVAYADPTAWFVRPVPIGVSTGHPDITAGTIGCRVIDDYGNVYALSNNHVYADCNEANIGDSALQPGPIDGGQDPEDSIGELFEFEPIDFSGGHNTIDAAIASSSTDLLSCSTPGDDGYGTPSSTIAEAEIGQAVQKYGRTTGLTHGWVSGINVTVDVCYECAGPFCFRCKKLARFVDQIAISPGAFSDGGDSGSLIVTDDSNKKPVGLLFAGSSTLTLANPIRPVLERFGVTVDDGSSPSNLLPTAAFSFTTQDLTVNFADQSTDPDGSIGGWDWDFGDNNTSKDQNPSHTYAANDTYTVTLTVTDNDSATDSVSKEVTVSEGSAEFTLTATGYKVKGIQKVDLEWSDATSAKVDIYRNDEIIATTENSGSYTDILGRPSKGTYTYKVCEQGTDTCSNEATVTF